MIWIIMNSKIRHLSHFFSRIYLTTKIQTWLQYWRWTFIDTNSIDKINHPQSLSNYSWKWFLRYWQISLNCVFSCQIVVCLVETLLLQHYQTNWTVLDIFLLSWDIFVLKWRIRRWLHDILYAVANDLRWVLLKHFLVNVCQFQKIVAVEKDFFSFIFQKTIDKSWGSLDVKICIQFHQNFQFIFNIVRQLQFCFCVKFHFSVWRRIDFFVLHC